MRRVYTAYAMRILGGTRARHFGVMVLSALLFMKYVSVLNVAENFSRVTVGGVGQFAVSAFEHTEMLTIIILGVFLYAVYSFWRGDSSMRMAHLRHMQMRRM